MKMKKRIDLNCDLGEWKTSDGILRDEYIMPFISSCNIACGGHIGDEQSIRATIRLAKKYGVSMGVHPSYPDRENFGRVVMDISPKELEESLIEQIKTFIIYLKEEGGTLHHIKPHGALYNQATKDRTIAEVIVSVMKQFDERIPFYLPPNSISKKVAIESGLKVFDEVFADRVYEEDLKLRSRTLSGAVLTNETDVIAQVRSMILKGEVLTYSGTRKPINAETVCLHSDTPGAIQLAKTIHEFLKSHGVEIISV